jgi:hypothetical protein
MTSAFWLTPDNDPGVGRQDRARVLHGEQEFVFHGPPPRAGTVLTGQRRISDVYVKTGKRGGEMSFMDVVTEYRDETGRLVAESRSTTIETGKPATEG